jgi:hypothetical protein
MVGELEVLAGESFCYLTTTGRVTGVPHTIEVWFALSGSTLYMLSGGRDRSDWVKNIARDASVTVRVEDRLFEGSGRVVERTGEEALARSLPLEKYQRDGRSLERWRRTALPVAVDLKIPPAAEV